MLLTIVCVCQSVILQHKIKTTPVAKDAVRTVHTSHLFISFHYRGGKNKKISSRINKLSTSQATNVIYKEINILIHQEPAGH